MQIIKTNEELRQWQQQQQAQDWALVPTMGNLHEGHDALLHEAKRHCERVAVSLYVNPTQFTKDEDYSIYPRSVESDIERLRDLGATMVLIPQNEMIYPFDNESIKFELPKRYTNILCGARRSGHFEGVTAVIVRLFNLLKPKYAIFGNKDYQQKWIIRRLVADLHFAIKIIGVETVRDAQGLALSSRNQYLTAQETKNAASLYRALQHCKQMLNENNSISKAINESRKIIEKSGGYVQYFEVRRQCDLQVATEISEDLVILVAAFFGRARLLDNLKFSS